MTIAKKTVFGALWNVSLNFYSQLSSLLIFALLARVLGVKEFGLMAFCFLITEMMVLLGNFGINQILIQRPKWNVRLAANCYWFLFLLSLIFASIIIVVVAPLSEKFIYKDSGLMLSALVAVPIINSLSLVSFARLQRSFRNKKITQVNVLSITLGGVISIYLVYTGYGVWAVIFGRVVQAAFASLLLITIDRFIPQYPLRKRYIKYIFNFGAPLFYNTCLHFFSMRSINFTTALLLGSTQFAYISVSQRAFRIVSEVTLTPLNSILLPSFSRTKSDVDLTPVYVKVVRLASSIVIPLYIGVALLSEELVLLAFGPKWDLSSDLLAILCFTVIPQMPVRFLASLLISKAHTKPVFKYDLIAAFLMFSCCAIGALHSIEWSLYGLLLANSIAIPIKFTIAKKYITLSAICTLKAVVPAVFSAIIMFFGVTILDGVYFSELSIFSSVFLKVLTGSLIYVFVMVLLFREHSFCITKDVSEAVRTR